VFSWRGPIVLVLAVTVAVSVCACVLAVVTGQLEVTANGVAWLGTVLGALVGIVGAYVASGLHRRGRGRGDDDDSDAG